ncbi:MAG: AsmA-like C-terminal region-containing protein [Hyphomicrobium sp.]
MARSSSCTPSTPPISGTPNGAIQAAGSFDFHGEKIDFDTALGASFDTQGMSRPVSASFSGKPLTATLEGSLMLGESPQLLAPKAELSATDLRAAARWLGVNWPSGRGFGAFRAKGQLEWVNRSIAFQNAAIELDENDANGTLSVNFAGPRPAIEGTLGLKTLDLTQYLKKGEAAQIPTSLLTAVSGADGLEFPLIEAVDADFPHIVRPRHAAGNHHRPQRRHRVGAQRQDARRHRRARVRRRHARRRTDPHRPERRQPSFGMQAKFESPDVGRAIQATFGHPTVQGRGSFTIDLTGTGNTGDALLRSLGGKLCVTLAEGGRIGIDVNVLTATESTTLPDAAWQEVSANAISVDKLDARFTVTDGVMRTQSAEAVSGQRALRADGAISLFERRLDLELAVGDIATPAADTAPATEVKLQPREIINMHGPWSGPTIRSEPAAGASKLGPPAPG